MQPGRGANMGSKSGQQATPSDQPVGNRPRGPTESPLTPRSAPLSSSGIPQNPPGKDAGVKASFPRRMLGLLARFLMGLASYPLRWLATEQCSLSLSGGHRIVLQNVHLLLSLFWLLCGFVMGEVMANLNDKLLLDSFLNAHQ